MNPNHLPRRNAYESTRATSWREVGLAFLLCLALVFALLGAVGGSW